VRFMLNHKRPRLTQSKFRLLYVGNDQKAIAALKKALTEPDYRLVTSSNDQSAVLFLKSEIPYDLLLIDLERQEAEGLKLAELAHSLPHRERMPIILLAATGSRRQLEIPAGVNKCLKKTSDMAAVVEAIRKITTTTPREF
jgi:CheY-like chemotaxis protein